jgi:hypothetical protein
MSGWNRNMVMGPDGAGDLNECAGEAQQKLTGLELLKKIWLSFLCPLSHLGLVISRGNA